MLKSLLQNLRLRAEAKTGLSSAVVILGLVAVVAAVMALLFLVFAAFIWLAERYSPLTAALVLAMLFVLVAILCGLGAVLGQRRNSERAKLELAVRGQSPLFDPATLGIALQIGRSIGLRRIAPLAAAGVLAAALAKEWFRDQPDQPAAEEEES